MQTFAAFPMVFRNFALLSGTPCLIVLLGLCAGAGAYLKWWCYLHSVLPKRSSGPWTSVASSGAQGSHVIMLGYVMGRDSATGGPV